MTVTREPSPRTQRPRASLWFLAFIELALAAVVARLMVGAAEDHSQHHAMHSHTQHFAWGIVEWALVIAVTLSASWFAIRRTPAAGLAAAACALGLIATSAARIAAAQSHLIAMVALEIAMTAAPLLYLSSRRNRRLPVGLARSRVWAAGTAVAFGSFIVAIHLPPVHERVMNGQHGFPLWVIILATVVATAFWSAVLDSDTTRRFRRRVLIGGQEAVAFIALLSLFGSWSTAPVGGMSLLPPGWDQPLGGVVMLITCFLVTRAALRWIGAESNEPTRPAD